MIENALLFDARTAVYRLASAEYPSMPPFHPSASYPEYRWQSLGPTNLVYEGVRELFHLLELDKARYGTASWNPLGEIVQPGDKVVIKPNYLWQSHKYRHDEWEQIITHGSVVRTVVDYVLLALDGRGEVWIADGPQLDANWEKIISRSGVRDVCEFYTSIRSVPVRLLDLRDTWIDVRGDVAYGRYELPSDPVGAIVVDLGEKSNFVGHNGSGRYYGADYDQAETNLHHSDGRHEYRISRTAVSADVFINLPKMKTHKKVGVTLCLKNLVGINMGRNWLPHHTDGDPSTGGDQFPSRTLRRRSERWGIRRFQRWTLRYPRLFAPIFRMARALALPFYGHTEKVIRSGNWHGNDTCWRMVLDINKCLLYSDGESFPTSMPGRYFAIVDGIIAGEGNGPAVPDPYPAGVLFGGFNPVAVDCLGASLMGFDPERIPQLRQALRSCGLPLCLFEYSDIQVASNYQAWKGRLIDIPSEQCFRFQPHFGWVGAIENSRSKWSTLTKTTL